MEDDAINTLLRSSLTDISAMNNNISQQSSPPQTPANLRKEENTSRYTTNNDSIQQETIAAGNVDDASVEKVVAKSKRAASFLWILLHAQNCPNTVTNCPHSACAATKNLLNHIKTCPGSQSSSACCPTKYQGCQDARKLLAHYRHCREKARQQRIQSRLKQSKPTKQTHFCLICTLLARHDKDVIEQIHSSRCYRVPTTTSASFPPSIEEKKTQSLYGNKTVKFDLNSESQVMSMPPPPPRLASAGSILPLLRNPKIPRRKVRPRAESMDERKSQFAKDDVPVDPTIELELKSKSRSFDENNEKPTETLPFRKRSVSFNVFTSYRNCETIMEE
mmetsp:Transcript_15695/g.19138  ORF Transcript_15695/g.19138 Transcript_15695/m.19138 type:complete len:334 (-) Transcript_15695:104-1105(-)